MPTRKFHFLFFCAILLLSTFSTHVSAVSPPNLNSPSSYPLEFDLAIPIGPGFYNVTFLPNEPYKLYKLTLADNDSYIYPEGDDNSIVSNFFDENHDRVYFDENIINGPAIYYLQIYPTINVRPSLSTPVGFSFELLVNNKAGYSPNNPVMLKEGYNFFTIDRETNNFYLRLNTKTNESYTIKQYGASYYEAIQADVYENGKIWWNTLDQLSDGDMLQGFSEFAELRLLNFYGGQQVELDVQVHEKMNHTRFSDPDMLTVGNNTPVFYGNEIPYYLKIQGEPGKAYQVKLHQNFGVWPRRVYLKTFDLEQNSLEDIRALTPEQANMNVTDPLNTIVEVRVSLVINATIIITEIESVEGPPDIIPLSYQSGQGDLFINATYDNPVYVNISTTPGEFHGLLVSTTYGSDLLAWINGTETQLFPNTDYASSNNYVYPFYSPGSSILVKFTYSFTIGNVVINDFTGYAPGKPIVLIDGQPYMHNSSQYELYNQFFVMDFEPDAYYELSFSSGLSADISLVQADEEPYYSNRYHSDFHFTPAQTSLERYLFKGSEIKYIEILRLKIGDYDLLVQKITNPSNLAGTSRSTAVTLDLSGQNVDPRYANHYYYLNFTVDVSDRYYFYLIDLSTIFFITDYSGSEPHIFVTNEDLQLQADHTYQVMVYVESSTPFSILVTDQPSVTTTGNFPTSPDQPLGEITTTTEDLGQLIVPLPVMWLLLPLVVIPLIRTRKNR